MEFKMPKLRAPKRKLQIPPEIRQTEKKGLQVIKIIGQGAYGSVSLCDKQGQLFVMKRQIQASDELYQKLFVKEARLLQMCDHDNIVKFDSIVTDPMPYSNNLALLLEYLTFDFSVFGEDLQVHSLADLLPVLDSNNFSGFEHFNKYIAQDVCDGLTYLHGKGIVHRDLKPANILVSNQHYSNLGEEGYARYEHSKPVVAKLTDFGEGRTQLVQTATLVSTCTANVDRGTPAYMAPEALCKYGKSSASIDDLKSMDVWAFGMVLFTLLNPDVKHPYEPEIREVQATSVENGKTILKCLLKKKQLPRQSNKYEQLRSGTWSSILTVHEACSQFGKRPMMAEIATMINTTQESKSPVAGPSRQLSPDRVEKDAPYNGPPSKRKRTAAMEASLSNSLTNNDLMHIQGNFHQASPHVFQHSAAGTQCATISVMAVLAAQLKPATEWKSSDINELLIQGDRCHQLRLHQLGWPTSREETRLDMDEFDAVMGCSFGNIKIEASIGLLDDPRFGFTNEIPHIIRRAAEEHPDTGFVIRMMDKCRAIIPGKDTYSIFDSHACDEYGLAHPHGKACVLHFRTLDALIDYFVMMVNGCKEEQVDVHAVKIAVLSSSPPMDVIDISSGSEDSTEIAWTSIKQEQGGSITASSSSATQAKAASPSPPSTYMPPGSASSPSKNGSPRPTSISSTGSQHSDSGLRLSGASALSGSGSPHLLWTPPLPGSLGSAPQAQIPLVSGSPSGSECLNRSQRPGSGGQPVYISGISQGLTTKEILDLCHYKVIPGEEVCDSVPSPKKDSVFLVDLTKVNEKDLSCDDSGSYTSHSTPIYIVLANCVNGKLKEVNVIARSKLPGGDARLQQGNIHEVRRQYSSRVNAHGKKVSRIIAKVFTKGQVSRYGLIQYIGDVGINLRAHGNSKSANNVYVRTKPSVLKRGKDLATNEAPKQVINIIDEECGGPLAAKSASDLLRNRDQIYNAKRDMPGSKRFRNTGRLPPANLDKLTALMDEGSFLRKVSYSHTPSGNIRVNTFAASDNSLKWMGNFCTPGSHIKSPLCIDMTYKVGPYYTTFLSFANPMVVHRTRPSCHPTTVLAMMTSATRQVQDYGFMAHQVKERCPTLIYGTDGEFALETAMEDVFPIEHVDTNKKSIHLRCFNHVNDDIKKKLKSLEIINDGEIITSILGKEYNGRRQKGLVDEHTPNFYKHYAEVSKNWPEDFTNYMAGKDLRVRPLRDTLLHCMGWDAREAAGLGNPPNKFSNQRAESINNVVKESLGNTFTDQTKVHELVYDKVVRPHENEIMKAVFGLGEYRLSEPYRHLQVSPSAWNSMTWQQKEQKTKALFSKLPEPINQPIITRRLSVQPDEYLGGLSNLPLNIINRLWNEAEIILSYHQIQELQSGGVCIVDDNSAVVVDITKGTKFSCQCKDFVKFKVCPHVLVTVDFKGYLHQFMTAYHYNSSQVIDRNRPSGAGQKRNKKPRKGKQNIKCHPIHSLIDDPNVPGEFNAIDLKQRRAFQNCEIWHNNEPFNIINVQDIKVSNKRRPKCETCTSEINIINAICPYDIVFIHFERYSYPVKDSHGKVIHFANTQTKLASRYYCVRRSCLLQRHPYFWHGIIRQDGVTLNQLHKKLLKDVLNYEI